MGEEIAIRKEGHAGRITLNRPAALNALTWDMCRRIAGALEDWRDDPEVALLLIDAAGEKAFCAGGDIAEMHATGVAGDYDYGRRFWADEYRMNAALFAFPKPVVTFLQGYTMGGGVGVGCHGSHRIVGETSRIAMPEVGIGLIPDVGGSLILARAPGRLGEYLGVSAARMGPGEAIHAGFADYFLPEPGWVALKSELADTGEWSAVDRAARPAPESALTAVQEEIDVAFAGARLRDIVNALQASGTAFAAETLAAMARNSPLSMAATVDLIRRVRGRDTMEAALEMEYRFTARAMEMGDFLEGIRAAIIDKDRQPRWRHDGLAGASDADVSAMLMPLGAAGLKL